MSTTTEEETQAYLYAVQLALAGVFPMALRAAIELDLLEIFARAGPGARLSSAQVAAQLPTSDNPDAPAMLDRILRVLASYNILTLVAASCSTDDHNPEVEDDVVVNDVAGTMLYGAAPVCKYLTDDRDGFSMAPTVLLGLDRVFLESWYNLKDAVLHGGTPFKRAHGVAPYEHRERDDRFRRVFEATNRSSSTLLDVQSMLDAYRGWFDDGLQQDGCVVVDVGGGTGVAVGLVVSRYPGIRGVNFDRPDVVDKAPVRPGVEHVGGDMFERVPKGDIMFMKGILHNWGNDQCVQVLRNCWEALPESGKVISMETVLPGPQEQHTKQAQIALEMDLIMMTHFAGGKARTEEEYRALAMAAGFTGFRRVCCASTTAVMELCK